MHRSILCHLRRQIKGCRVLRTSLNLNGNAKGCCIQAVTKLLPASTSVFASNSFHTSLTHGAGDDNAENDLKTKSKTRKGKRNKAKASPSNDEQLESAAIDAAKSLPGDWTRTADELMARLAVHGSSQQSEDIGTEKSAESSPLLSTMKVARNFDISKTRNMDKNGRGLDGRDTSVEDRQMMNQRRARKSEQFNSLYSQPRLGVFDAEKVKAAVRKGIDESKEEKESLRQAVYKEKIDLAKGGLPRNGFEELIQWTKEGRMWTFPVNNEEDMHEERQYEFHEHVFLSHHLGDFPLEGPLRRFMDLVVIGLSQNPWISVPEKVEHIRWYADYFRQKQQLLESSIGDKAKMKLES